MNTNKKFTKDQIESQRSKTQPSHNPQNRTRTGSFAGVVGMICNVLLFAVKFIIGQYTRSIAIIGDSFNNISDAGVSFMALLGFRISERMNDEAHPFGHGRVEYISGLVISFLIFLTAIEIGKESFTHLWKSEPVVYNGIIVCILLFTICIKIGFGVYAGIAAKKTRSNMLKTISHDSFIDAFLSGTTVASMVVSSYVPFPIDAVCGIAMAIWIFISGWNLADENINRLIGEKPDPVLVEKITAIIMSSECITGYHNLFIHDYGHDQQYFSVHVEVPADSDIAKVYSAIENLSRKIYEEFGIELAIHVNRIEI